MSDDNSPSTHEQSRTMFRNLGVWRSGDERAPYKPLLLLWTLARYQRGERRLVPYSVISQELLPIFRSFGPARAAYHTEYPFWYLQNDGVWEVKASGPLVVREGKAGQPTKQSLLSGAAEGGLTPELFEAVTGDPQLLRDVASDLLNGHFPETLHEDILSAVGLQLNAPKATRDPQFRASVLLAYEFRCAVCGFDARLSDALVGLEAAHIKWHQAGGPATVVNGLALCSLHHKLFDRGAFTLTADRRVEVSQHVNGGPATRSALVRFHTLEVGVPGDPSQRPASGFIEWHREEVFRKPGRYAGVRS